MRLQKTMALLAMLCPALALAGATSLIVTDANGNKQTISEQQDAGNSNYMAGRSVVIDPVSGNGASVKAAATAPTTSDQPMVVTQAPVGQNPCLNPAATLSMFTATVSNTSLNTMTAAASPARVYICSVFASGYSGSGLSFNLVQGTGTNCGTSQSFLLEAITVTTGTLLSVPGPIVANLPAGYSLCYNVAGSTPFVNLLVNFVVQ